MIRALIALLLVGLTALSPALVHSVTVVAPGAAATGSALTGSGGSSPFSTSGQNWSLSQSVPFQNYDPLGRIDFPSVPLGTAQRVWCFFRTDTTLACFGRAAPVTSGAIEHYMSVDAGQSFQAIAQITAIWNAANNEVNGVRDIATGGYIFVSGRNTCTATDGPFYTSADGFAMSVKPCSGTISTVNQAPSQQNGTTFLVQAGTVAGNDQMCRTSDTGGSWLCFQVPAITGYTGGGSWRFAGGNNGYQTFAPVTTNIWLTVGNDSGDGRMRILRSTDDGQTWSQVLDSGVAVVFPAVQCLSSTVCLVAQNDRIWRSADGGATWTAVVTTGPSGANTRWQAVVVFDPLTATVNPWGAGNGSGFAMTGRTTDGGVTWTFGLYKGGPNSGGACPQSSGAEAGLHNVAVRNGRAVIISNYGALTSPLSPCVHYASLGTGGTAITGPLGIPWGITNQGEGPVSQGDGWFNSNRVPWIFTPAQRPTILNTSTTGAANTAVVVTLAAAQGQRAHVYAIEAFCAAAGTAQMTIQDGAATIYLSPAAGIPTAPATLRREWNPPLTNILVNTAMTLTAAACGVGNTTTLHVHADRY